MYDQRDLLVTTVCIPERMRTKNVVKTVAVGKGAITTNLPESFGSDIQSRSVSSTLRPLSAKGGWKLLWSSMKHPRDKDAERLLLAWVKSQVVALDGNGSRTSSSARRSLSSRLYILTDFSPILSFYGTLVCVVMCQMSMGSCPMPYMMVVHHAMIHAGGTCSYSCQ